MSQCQHGWGAAHRADLKEMDTYFCRHPWGQSCDGLPTAEYLPCWLSASHSVLFLSPAHLPGCWSFKTYITCCLWWNISWSHHISPPCILHRCLLLIASKCLLHSEPPHVQDYLECLHLSSTYHDVWVQAEVLRKGRRKGKRNDFSQQEASGLPLTVGGEHAYIAWARHLDSFYGVEERSWSEGSRGLQS